MGERGTQEGDSKGTKRRRGEAEVGGREGERPQKRNDLFSAQSERIQEACPPGMYVPPEKPGRAEGAAFRLGLMTVAEEAEQARAGDERMGANKVKGVIPVGCSREYAALRRACKEQPGMACYQTLPGWKTPVLFLLEKIDPITATVNLVPQGGEKGVLPISLYPTAIVRPDRKTEERILGKSTEDNTETPFPRLNPDKDEVPIFQVETACPYNAPPEVEPRLGGREYEIRPGALLYLSLVPLPDSPQVTGALEERRGVDLKPMISQEGEKEARGGWVMVKEVERPPQPRHQETTGRLEREEKQQRRPTPSGKSGRI